MIYFTGDINLTDWDFNVGFGIGSRISCGLDPFSFLERKEDDIWVGNFEGVTSNQSTKEGFKSEVFRVKPEFLKRIKHFEFYGFANNHAMQHGEGAYQETVKSLESFGCGVFGTQKRKSVLLDHQGREVSLTGLCLRIDEFTDKPSYWYNPEYKEIEDEISKLPSQAFKVLFVHWGNEYINRPSSAQKKYAHWLIDAGFNLIIGMHPHVLQGYEDYKGKRIYYSLGNFVFEMASKPCRYGAIIGLNFNNDKAELTEHYIQIDKQCCPHVIEKNNVPERYRFDYLNECLKKEDNSEQYHQEIMAGYKKYRKENHQYVIGNMLRHPKTGMMIMNDFLKRRLHI